jgi:predicted RNase H-like nuclease
LTGRTPSVIVEYVDRSRFKTFIGVDLGGGKGKNTAVAVLRAHEGGVRVEKYDTGDGHPWYDDRLITFLRGSGDDALLAIDAPLSLTACVRCREPVCPGMDECVDPTVAFFRAHAAARDGAIKGNGKKPLYTPYTQRLTEVLLHADQGILPRETLGQGMGPLTARAAHLVRALAGAYELNVNLIEVYPKATIWKLFGEKTARTYKRHHAQAAVRLANVLSRLPGLSFGPGQWRESGIQNDHLFDAVICAYTGYLWARDGWQLPTDGREVFAVDGWIWIPPGEAPRDEA